MKYTAGGDAVRRPHLADNPISHHNSWERVPTHPTYDIPSGVYDGGGACVPETPMETSDEKTGVAQPKGDLQSGVFDGGVTVFSRHYRRRVTTDRERPTLSIWTN